MTDDMSARSGAQKKKSPKLTPEASSRRENLLPKTRGSPKPRRANNRGRHVHASDSAFLAISSHRHEQQLPWGK
jgi:hypothetical protein